MPGSISMDDLLQRLRRFPIAMLATVSQDGYIHARPMMTQERDANADLWFASALDTEKVAEIRQNPKVGVIYFRDADNAYISLAGEAHILDDRQLLQQKWRESWRPWFTQGPDQPNLCMIQVDAHSVELWEPEGGNQRVQVEIARAMATGEQARINPPIDKPLDSPDRRSA